MAVTWKRRIGNSSMLLRLISRPFSQRASPLRPLHDILSCHSPLIIEAFFLIPCGQPGQFFCCPNFYYSSRAFRDTLSLCVASCCSQQFTQDEVVGRAFGGTRAHSVLKPNRPCYKFREQRCVLHLPRHHLHPVSYTCHLHHHPYLAVEIIIPVLRHGGQQRCPHQA